MKILFNTILISLVFILLFSSATIVFAQDSVAPATPRGFDAGTVGVAELVVSWINPSDADLAHINLYWWQSAQGFSGVPFEQISALPDTKGERRISNIATGVEYKLFLEAVDGAGNVSEPTATLKRTSSQSVDGASPSTAMSFTAQDATTGGALILAWTNPGDDDFFQTRVYRSTYDGFEPTLTTEIAQVFGKPSEVSNFTDTGLTNATEYHYALRTEDNRDNLYTSILGYPRASAIPTLAEEPEPAAPEGGEPSPEDSGLEPAVSPDLSGIADGDLITTADNPDIYIVKIVGAKKFKRLILNPDIFNSYGHLRWEDVKTVEQAVIDAFAESQLVQEVNADGSIADPKVFILTSEPNTDIGIKRWLNVTAEVFEQLGYDWDARFFINHTEAGEDFYPEGDPVTSL